MIITLRFLLIIILCIPLNAKPIIKGNGSISEDDPNKEITPQEKIYKTNNITKPIPTNDWWSSILWQKLSSNHFPHPLALDYNNLGLRIYYPGNSIYAFDKGMAAGMPESVQDLIIGTGTKSEFNEANVHDFSDWFVTSQLGNDNSFLRFSYGHGSPFIFVNYKNISPALIFSSNPTIWSKTKNAVGLTTDKGNNYGLFIPEGFKWNDLKSKTINANWAKHGFFSIAILPDKSPSTLDFFNNYAHNHIETTKVDWHYDQSQSNVIAKFTFGTRKVCDKHSGTNKTLAALYPHQWRRTNKQTLKYHYNSIRGMMKLAEGNSFEVNYEYPGVLPCLPLEVKNIKDELLDITNSKKNAQDSYWAGKELGNLSSASVIAEVCNHEKISTDLRKIIKLELEDWFSYKKTNGDKHFYYNENWGTLIGLPPSYGSSKEINDHHFHYGYFLRAAAEIARTEPEWIKEDSWGSVTNLLIQDIANSDRNNKNFPFLRNFDPYAGHSWASGHAKFADGNNQESSSESMNAWTGIILLGQFINDLKLRDLGIFLYSSELAAIEDYWFDVNQENHHEKIKSPNLAMIWGGKATYETWFSNAPHCKTGINILPIHGGSLYLGRYPKYVNTNYQFALNESNGKWSGWPSIMMSYNALFDANKSWKTWQEYGQKMPLDSGNTKANTVHWIQNLMRLGQLQKNITCNHPISASFKSSDGKVSHVVYVSGKKPIKVNFSNGVNFDAAPGKFTIKTIK